MKKRTATLALIVKKSNHVLLGRRARKGADVAENNYNGPGGKLKPGQTLYECLQEEMFDEVGITIPSDGAEEVAVITFHNGITSEWTVHVYLVRKWEGEPKSSDEMVEPEEGWWHKIDALPFHRMLASDQQWLPLALSGKRFHLDVFQNDDASELLGPLKFHFF